MVSLPALLPSLVCAQHKWPFNNVGQPTFPLKAFLLAYIAEWMPKSLHTTHLLFLLRPYPLLLFPPSLHSKHVASLMFFGNPRPVASGPLLWLSQRSVRNYPLVIQEASFLNPITFPQMPSSPWGLCWPPYLKLQPPALNSQYHLSCSSYCLPNCVTYCFYLLPNILIRM